jgi:hypothetical protein
VFPLALFRFMLKRCMLWRVAGSLRFSARASTARQHNGQHSEAHCCPAESDIEHDDVLLLQFTTRSGGDGDTSGMISSKGTAKDAEGVWQWSEAMLTHERHFLQSGSNTVLPTLQPALAIQSTMTAHRSAGASSMI